MKDICDMQNSTSASKWLDPDSIAFADIRNTIEHRSLKIVDDFRDELATSHNSYHDEELRKLQEQINTLPIEI
ncbi:hypothetical protein [Citrobacter gillenii]|uniref:hypothetical protein n=1 Tax=Citrobacter gillenii TaxID=67828 RepID=UPI003C12F809